MGNRVKNLLTGIVVLSIVVLAAVNSPKRAPVTTASQHGTDASTTSSSASVTPSVTPTASASSSGSATATTAIQFPAAVMANVVTFLSLRYTYPNPKGVTYRKTQLALLVTPALLPTVIPDPGTSIDSQVVAIRADQAKGYAQAGGYLVDVPVTLTIVPVGKTAESTTLMTRMLWLPTAGKWILNSYSYLPFSGG
jgi:hypothetical protein